MAHGKGDRLFFVTVGIEAVKEDGEYMHRRTDTHRKDQRGYNLCRQLERHSCPTHCTDSHKQREDDNNQRIDHRGDPSEHHKQKDHNDQERHTGKLLHIRLHLVLQRIHHSR